MRIGGWFTNAPSVNCPRSVKQIYKFKSPGTVHEDEYSPEAMEASLNSDSSTRGEYYPIKMSRCFNRNHAGKNANELSQHERKVVVAAAYFAKKKLELGVKSLLSTVADYDNLLGKSPLSDLAKDFCGHPGLVGTEEYCAQLSQCPKDPGMSAFEEQVRIAKQALKVIDIVDDTPTGNLNEDFVAKKRQIADSLKTLHPWLKKGSVFRNALKDDRDWIPVRNALLSHFTAARANVVNNLREHLSVASCFNPKIGGSPPADCSSKAVGKFLEKTPAYPKLAFLSQEPTVQTRYREVDIMMGQAACFLGSAEAVRLDNDTRNELLVNLGLTAVGVGAGPAIARAMAVGGRAVAVSAQSARVVEAAIGAVRIAPATARVVAALVDAGSAAKGIVDAIGECKELLNQWDRPITAASSGVPACPGTSTDPQRISRAFTADVTGCVIAGAGSVVPIVLPGVARKLGKVFQVTPVARTANKVFFALASKFDRFKSPPSLFVHVENAYLKSMNNIDFDKATEITQKYLSLLQREVDADPELAGKVMVSYQDYKGVRLAFDGDPAQLENAMLKIHGKIENEFADWAKSNGLQNFLPHGGTHQPPKEWFNWGSGLSDSEAEIAAREARGLKTGGVVRYVDVDSRVVSKLKGVETSRAALEKSLPRDLLDDGVLNSDAIEILRSAQKLKGRTNDPSGRAKYLAHLATRFKQRFGVSLANAQLDQMAKYFSDVDTLMIGVYQTSTKSIKPPARTGFYAMDRAGLGPDNVHAAMKAMSDAGRRGLGVRETMSEVRKSSEKVTQALVTTLDTAKKAAASVGIQAKVERSGDDLWLVVNRDLSPAQQHAFADALARNEVGKKLRLMFTPKALGGKPLTAAQKLDLTGGMSLMEKNLRLKIESEFSDPAMRRQFNRVTLGMRMDDQGGVELLMGVPRDSPLRNSLEATREELLKLARRSAAEVQFKPGQSIR